MIFQNPPKYIQMRRCLELLKKGRAFHTGSSRGRYDWRVRVSGIVFMGNLSPTFLTFLEKKLEPGEIGSNPQEIQE